MIREKSGPKIRNLAVSAMLMAAGIVLPFLTGQIPQVGSMLLPMHIPALLCGLICGWQYGGAVGFLLPLVRYMLFGMPPVPLVFAMSLELAAYGMISGALYQYSRWKCIVALYRSLIAAMTGGRIVWGIACVLITGVTKEAFTWKMFLTGAFFSAIPGIILQLTFIPALMAVLGKTGMISFGADGNKISQKSN